MYHRCEPLAHPLGTANLPHTPPLLPRVRSLVSDLLGVRATVLSKYTWTEHAHIPEEGPIAPPALVSPATAYSIPEAQRLSNTLDVL
jgi:hypothetical protein